MTVEVGRNERSFESKKSSHEIDSVQSTKMGLNLRARRKAVDINGTRYSQYDVLDYGRGTVNVVYECIPVPFPFLRHNQISKNLVFPARGLAAVRLLSLGLTFSTLLVHKYQKTASDEQAFLQNWIDRH